MQPATFHIHQNSEMNDKVILQHLMEGSREALAMLWQDQSANVLNLAFRMLKDRDQAEDILMDVFVQVPKAVQGFRGDSALGTWLYRLTVNACLMKLRTKKRHRELEDEKLVEEFYDKVIESYEYGENYYMKIGHYLVNFLLYGNNPNNINSFEEFCQSNFYKNSGL